MLYNIVKRMASDTGLDSVQQASTLSKLINNSAEEIHRRLECNKIYRVVTLVVPPNLVVSLPYYVGDLRGVKNHCNEMMTNISNLGQPRFTKSTYEYQINRWTENGDSPLSQNMSTIGPLTLQCNSVDNAVVLVNGQITSSQAFEESVLLNAQSVMTVNLFGINIYNIACFTPRTSDISILDSNGVLISTLYASQERTKFKIIDVSKFIFGSNEAPNNNLMDVLYKIPFVPLTNNTDSFAAGDDYDNVIYHYAMYLYYLPMAGKEQDASIAKSQAFQSLKAIKDNEESGVVKKLNFGRCKFYNLADRFRYLKGVVNNSVTDYYQTNYQY